MVVPAASQTGNYCIFYSNARGRGFGVWIGCTSGHTQHAENSVRACGRCETRHTGWLGTPARQPARQRGRERKGTEGGGEPGPQLHRLVTAFHAGRRRASRFQPRGRCEGAEDEGILNGQPAGRWALPGSPLPSAGVAWPPAGTRMDQCVVTAAASLASSSL